MVKILSNGEIVPDDDPRARGGNTPNNTAGGGNRPRQGFVQHADYGPMNQDGQGQGMYMGGQQVSIFDSLNQRLLGMGLPRFTVGQWTIEPIVTVGFLLAAIFFGLPGLIFAGLLFVVSKISQPGGNPFTDGGGGGVGGWWNRATGGDRPGSGGDGRGGGGGGGGGGSRGFGGGGGGNRLGRS